MEKKSHKQPAVKSSVVAAVAATAALAEGTLTTSKHLASLASTVTLTPTHAGDAASIAQQHETTRQPTPPPQQHPQHAANKQRSISASHMTTVAALSQQHPPANNLFAVLPGIPASATGKSHNSNNNNDKITDTAHVSQRHATKSPIPGANNSTALEHYSAALNAKAVAARNKSEEAISDLRQRIPEIDNIFDVHSRIGNGTFSTVLLGTLKKERDVPEQLRRKFAIKHHIPTSHPDRIMKELQCMAKIGGTDNVVGINCCIRYNESVAFIMPYMPHDRFHDFFSKMDITEVQYYMKNLLIALRHVHKFNVIHRDVKPSNFLYNRRKRQFLLVDFGLAQQVPTPQVSVFGNVPNSTCASIVGTNNNNAFLPLPSNNAVEGKRSRELDESSGATTKTAEAPTTSGDVSGVAKRLRCTGPQGDQHIAVTPNAANTRTTNSCSVVPSGPGNGTPFKMPLKQLNEITKLATQSSAAGGGSNAPANDNNNNSGICETPAQPLSRQVKSAMLGANGGSRLQQKLRSVQQQQLGNAANNAQNSGAAVPLPAGANSPAVPAGAASGSTVATVGTTTADANKYNTNRNLTTANKCFCYGNPQVCNICLIKKEIHASRAGTPGYRPPEVLLKYPDQTTAVDVWAAGVIFLSILSSVYPFFKAPNDYVALAEMVTIFGDKTIRKTAFVLDRLVTLSQKTKPLDLRKLCVRFRNRTKFSSPELLRKYQRQDGTCEVCKNCDQFYFNCLCTECHYKTEPLDGDDPFPPSAYDLLYKLLEVNPHKRITAEDALKHPFFSEMAALQSAPSDVGHRKKRE